MRLLHIAKLPILVGGVLLSICVLGAVLIRSWGTDKKRMLLNLNHAEILSVCRNMISNRRNYRNDNHGRSDVILLNPHIAPLEESVPYIIRETKPSYISISADQVQICYSALPRIYLVAFAEGTRQHGVTQLVDGLWLSDGKD